MKKIIAFTIVLSLFFTNISYSATNTANYKLIEAVKNNNIANAQKYLKKGNINKKDKLGNTPLSYSVANDNYIMTKLLLNNGANPLIVDNSDKYIYCSAKKSKNIKMRRLFDNYNLRLCNNKIEKNNSSKSNNAQAKKTLQEANNYLFNKKNLGLATIGIVGAGAGTAFMINHNKNKNNQNTNNNNDYVVDKDYSNVGYVDSEWLNAILNGNTYNDINYSGYNFSVTFGGGKTYSNYGSYNLIRLAYAWARGYRGQVNGYSYLSNSDGYPYYFFENNNVNNYSIGDKIKIAVLDQGVYATNPGLSSNIGSVSGSIDSNQMYQYYLDNCTGNNSCSLPAFSNNSTMYVFLHCNTTSPTSLDCGVYKTCTSGGVCTEQIVSTFAIQSNDSTPLNSDSQHGTMVSSIIVGNPYGLNYGSTGISPDAEVLPYLIATEYNFTYNEKNYFVSNFADDDYIGQAFLSAGQNGAIAINNSWGSGISWNPNSSSYFYTKNNEIYYRYNNVDQKITESLLKGVMPFMNDMVNVVENYDSIFVFSAGNDGQNGPSLQGLIPLYLTGSDGNLLFYDQSTGYYKNFIVSAAYDTENNRIASYSNRCGVAKYYCLTAPGTNLVLDYGNTGSALVVSSGTSFSAPVISGAIAVLKGAFPYLTSAEITKILFLTARDIGAEGVDDVYGWGMLDLERATRPYGATIVPIDSTITSSGQPLTSSTIKLNSTIANSIKNQNLKFIILDDFKRAFTLNLNDYLQSEKARSNTIDILKKFGNNKISKLNLTKDKSFTLYHNIEKTTNNLSQEFELSYTKNKIFDGNYSINFYYGNNPYNIFINDKTDFYNNYSLSNTYEYNVLNPYFKTNSNNNFAMSGALKLSEKFNLNFGTIYQDYTMNYDKIYNNKKLDDDLGSAFAILAGIDYNLNNHISFGIENTILNEKETFLGTKWSGAFGLGQNNLTYITSLQNNINVFDNKLSLFTKTNFAYTNVNNASKSLIKDISNIYSNSFSVGMNYNFKYDTKSKSNISLLLTQPVKIQSGNFNINLPYARDYKGNIYYKTNKINFDDDSRIDLQLTYNKMIVNNSLLNLGIMYRKYLENEYIFLLNYKKSFNF